MKTERRTSGHSRKAQSEPTRAKLLRAAGEVFTDVGYHAATIRDICARAGTNNGAAVSYYFRDKLGLYTEVLNQSIRTANVEGVRSALEQNGAPEEILRGVIRARLRGIASGDLASRLLRIMVHEFVQPTPALKRIISRVQQPIYKRVLKLIGRIIGFPADAEITRLCAQSIMGQVFLYVLMGPVLAPLRPELKMTPGQVDKIADHIAEFSFAYLRQVGLRHSSVRSSERARKSK
jgi:TetR/AcrR family transcriptional regulator, regulator of cefoperazone and chloramphenicol sensitivity